MARKPTTGERLVAIEEVLVQLVQDMEGVDDSLVGVPGAENIGSASEWLGQWLAMKSAETPKLKIGWGSEKVNRRRKSRASRAVRPRSHRR